MKGFFGLKAQAKDQPKGAVVLIEKVSSRLQFVFFDLVSRTILRGDVFF